MSRPTKILPVEKDESMFITWGRIVTIAREYVHDARLLALVEKFNKDMAQALITEKHFK
jgi:hypothetical protein